MAITAQKVNELRQKTGAGMMDCKKALTEADGDFDKAIEILRKKGAAVAAKRADRDTNEGIVLSKLSDDMRKASIVEVNCETDFVAKSDDFIDFANLILDKAYSGVVSNTEATLSNDDIKLKLDELVGKIGEKIVINRISNVEAPNGMIINYTHTGSKLGVLVLFDNLDSDKFPDFNLLAKDVAMQVAAMKPVSTYRDEVEKGVIEKEIEIYKEIAKREGKPEQILDKIAQGKLNKYYQENCLSEQAYIKDPSKSVSDLVKEFNAKYAAEVKIRTFLRYQLGDK